MTSIVVAVIISRPSGRALRSAAVALALCACGSDPAPTAPPGPAGEWRIQAKTPDTLDLGQVRALGAQVVDGAGRPVAATAVRWTSDHPGIVAVTGDGEARALAVGRATLRVTAGDLTAATTMVVQRPVGRIAVSAASVEVAVGGQTYMYAEAYDTEGAVQWRRPIAFAGDDPTIASIDPRTRLVTGHRAGATTITITAGTVSRSVPVTVAPLASGDFDVETRLARVNGVDSATVRTLLEAPLAAAAARWERVLVGGFPPATFSVDADDCDGLVTGEVPVGDVLVLVEVRPMDGMGRVLAAGGPCVVRDVAGRKVTAIGRVLLDAADVMEIPAGLLATVLTHEVGHVLGIGTLWLPERNPGLVDGVGTPTERFLGERALAQNAALGFGPHAPIPLFGLSHWGAQYRGELMLPGGGTVLSRLSVGALADIGYDVDVRGADPYFSDAPQLGAAWLSRVAPRAAAQPFCGNLDSWRDDTA